MSNHWTLHCESCDEDSHFSENHGERRLAQLLEHRQWLEAIPDNIDSPGGDFSSLESTAHWLRKHKGHNVVVRSEYGYNFADCAAWFKCPKCGSSSACRKPRGHEGEHEL